MIREGDTVVAVVGINGRSDYVPPGTEGELIDAGGAFRSPQVAFTGPGGRRVVVEVDPREIEARG